MLALTASAARVSLRALRAGSRNPARFLRILAADPVDAVCAQVFQDNGHKLVEKKLSRVELLEQIGTYDGLVVRSGVQVTEDIIAAGTKLKIIGRAGAGVDNIDTAAATRHGVIVMNTPGGNTSAAAELTLSLLTNLARNIPAAVQSMKDGHWDRKRFANGVELRGKTVGVVGLGMIGAEVARRCLALDMKVIGFDPVVSEAAATAAGIRKVTLDELWGAADFVTLHTPLNAATRHVVNAATLAKCRKGVFVINAARGGVVDEAALLAALESGHVAGAALDVYETEPPTAAARPLLTHPRVLCTPHLGASTEEAQRKVAREIAQQMSDAFRARGFVGVVNAAHLGLLAARPALAPYVRLAEALGSLQAQTAEGTGPRQPGEAASADAVHVSIETAGPVFEGSGAAAAELLKASLLKGLLPALPGHGDSVDPDALNLVNAASQAEAAGIRVTVAPLLAAAAAPYANLLRVTLVARGVHTVAAGSVIGAEPRVVQMGLWKNFPSFPVSPAAPSSAAVAAAGSGGAPAAGAAATHLLTFTNRDLPGVVSRTAAVLAEANINIASMAVARQFPGSPALSVLICDSRIPAAVLRQINTLDGIHNAKAATLQVSAAGAAALGDDAGLADAALGAAA